MSAKSKTKVWEATIKMEDGGNEHVWHTYVEARSQGEANREVLKACCHCYADEILWGEGGTEATCTVTGIKYSVKRIEEATWRERA